MGKVWLAVSIGVAAVTLGLFFAFWVKSHSKPNAPVTVVVVPPSEAASEFLDHIS